MLDDADKALLGQRPFMVTIYKGRKASQAEASRFTRIKRLSLQGYLSGRVQSSDALAQVMHVQLTDKGRVAIGRAPLGAVS